MAGRMSTQLLELVHHDSTTAAEGRSNCGFLLMQIEIENEMTVNLTKASNYISHAKSWLLVLLVFVICNFGFAAFSEHELRSIRKDRALF